MVFFLYELYNRIHQQGFAKKILPVIKQFIVFYVFYVDGY